MFEFLQNLQWYEWIFGLVAAGVVGFFAYYALMVILVMFIWHFLTNENFQKVTFTVILVGAGAYIFQLITKYT